MATSAPFECVNKASMRNTHKAWRLCLGSCVGPVATAGSRATSQPVVQEAELVWDIRLCCISLAPLHMVMHCDTRRAYWDETTRIFASGGGGCAIEVWLQFGNSGCAVTCLCLQPVRGIWKCDGRW